MKPRVIFMGTPEFAVPILKTLIETPTIEVVLVVTKPDAYIGRKKVLTPSPVKLAAQESNIPTLEPLKIKDCYEEIAKYNSTLIVTCAYGQIVPKNILDLPSLGCINIHASLLPKYRGGAPIHRALMNGEKESGITIMYMDENMDTGDIISSASLPIADTDNVATLHDKLSALGSSLLKETLPSILNQTNSRISQDNSLATYAPTIKREDEHLNFNDKALNIHNKIRALNSWPLAYFILNNEEIKAIEGYIGEATSHPASLVTTITKDAIGISCQDKIYYLTKIKPFGKKIMLVKDYLNGINKETILNKEVK